MPIIVGFDGDGEVLHPFPATRFAPNEKSDFELAHMSQKSSTSMPQTRKERQASDVRGLPVGLTAPDEQARVGLAQAYNGGKKPILVLRFHEERDGYVCALMEGLEIRIRRGDEDGVDHFTAFLLSGRGKIFSASRASSPFMAFRDLADREKWFYHAGQWRALSWVYKKVQATGLISSVKLPEQYETAIRSNDRMHVQGTWCWQLRKIRTVPEPRRIVLPKNKGMKRFHTDKHGNPIEPMPPLRSNERWVQDQKIMLSRKFDKTLVGDKLMGTGRLYYVENPPKAVAGIARIDPKTYEGTLLEVISDHTGGAMGLAKDGGLV